MRLGVKQKRRASGVEVKRITARAHIRASRADGGGDDRADGEASNLGWAVSDPRPGGSARVGVRVVELPSLPPPTTPTHRKTHTPRVGWAAGKGNHSWFFQPAGGRGRRGGGQTGWMIPFMSR